MTGDRPEDGVKGASRDEPEDGVKGASRDVVAGVRGLARAPPRLRCGGGVGVEGVVLTGRLVIAADGEGDLMESGGFLTGLGVDGAGDGLDVTIGEEVLIWLFATAAAEEDDAHS